MITVQAQIEQRANWLGYLGLVPFAFATLLILAGVDHPLIQQGLQSYAAVILTFVGAIQWGRALFTGESQVITLSVIPSILAWGSLLCPPEWALPMLVTGFALLYLFETGEYGEYMAWFRRLRWHLTLAVCSLLTLNWLVLQLRVTS